MYVSIFFCRKFSHPNIVKILAVCVDNDPVFIIMELMPAGDLLKFLRDARPESVSLQRHTCRCLLCTLCAETKFLKWQGLKFTHTYKVCGYEDILITML